jgi:putative N-acetylmannosamine-6-phosphate epimerase
MEHEDVLQFCSREVAVSARARRSHELGQAVEVAAAVACQGGHVGMRILGEEVIQSTRAGEEAA